MEKWKMSKYNILCENDNQSYILNTVTGAIGEIDEQTKNNFI